MSSALDSLKIKAKLLQKAKKKAGKPIRLKDAFETLARHAGFESWRDLKEVFEATELFCPPGTSAHWKTWYSSYEEALEHLKTGPGYLLPYRKHFFVCEADYLEHLGVARDDADLEKVGRNWVEPGDAAAWTRLLRKIAATSEKRG